MISKSIAVSCGDPNGIGYEITVAAVKKLKGIKDRIILLGDLSCLKSFGWSPSLCLALNVFVPGFNQKNGKVDAKAGLLSYKSFDLAARLANSKRVCAIVTAPVSKDAWFQAGIKYMGHTDYFEKKFKIKPLMSFHGSGINCSLISEHAAIKNVASFITKKNIEQKILIFNSALEKMGIKGEILVSALNPHCGENGLLGKEELCHIIPAIKKLAKKIKISGPYNPDSIFDFYLRKKAAGAVFMYHDQLLSPFKRMVSQFKMVHSTWGLPFVRTSPAHGTAFDLAGSKKADCEGMFEAIKFAANYKI